MYDRVCDKQKERNGRSNKLESNEASNTLKTAITDLPKPPTDLRPGRFNYAHSEHASDLHL
ncbi:hypothetical protein L218DRAFT_964511 [Marasmius fiardii PR-910]|nr:hypothetical protein L218DRAFT_964511 [Marasmius fiardii PR-910]